MPAISQSAKLFQERRIPQDRPTHRLPTPRSNLDRNRVHSIPISAPFPLPEVTYRESPEFPDAHLTQSWPFGDTEIS